jgi:hypothetical protein
MPTPRSITASGAKAPARPNRSPNTLKVAVELYGQEPASEFGPLKYQHVRDRMIAKDWSRGHINKQCSRIKRAFRWAVTQELIPAAVAGALREVEDLKKGRTLAREASQVKPVDRAVVAKTLKHVNPVVAAMIRLQYETAMRPGRNPRTAPLRRGPLGPGLLDLPTQPPQDGAQRPGPSDLHWSQRSEDPPQIPAAGIHGLLFQSGRSG